MSVASLVCLRPPQTAPKSVREYDYVLDRKLLHVMQSRLVPHTLGVRALGRQVNRDICQLSQPDDVQLYLRRPLLVRRLNVTETIRRAIATKLTTQQPPAEPAAFNGWPRLRLVHHQWRDLAEFPCFTERLHDVRTSSGRDVTLTVRLRGFPDCEVLWYKDGRPLARHRPQNVAVRQYSKTLFVLHIRQAQPTDAGVYSCTAHNCAGAVRTSGYVHVEPYRGPYLPVRLNKWM